MRHEPACVDPFFSRLACLLLLRRWACLALLVCRLGSPCRFFGRDKKLRCVDPIIPTPGVYFSTCRMSAFHLTPTHSDVVSLGLEKLARCLSRPFPSCAVAPPLKVPPSLVPCLAPVNHPSMPPPVAGCVFFLISQRGLFLR
jgi:hypothetical protein